MTDHPTEAELSELKRAATAAPAGPWVWERNYEMPDSDDPHWALSNPDIPGVTIDYLTVLLCNETWPLGVRADKTPTLAYIAAANPETILSLISALEAARRDAAGMRAEGYRAGIRDAVKASDQRLQDFRRYASRAEGLGRSEGARFWSEQADLVGAMRFDIQKLEAAAGTGDGR